ncbi:metallophosphoesterase family protein (plasmid) [Pontibacillus sp. ALD_SL1]|uniref:metallophosphoesterase family protein n=1 Tax=Pontibacillus sp. ALD_SL1 TaxID=2777185 RepID=UPI001A977F15|nr:metallophosphoesterase family protein [Pontibacillus sp. ALD_SL1]QST02408.1 metallophosphoesterase family protein [Pontibacillus sp. ALD_SL1]
MKFDLISDVHLDECEHSPERAADEVIPDAPSDILVFAGDFGFDDVRNERFMRRLGETYETILTVHGNNDNGSRWEAAKAHYERLEGILHSMEGVHSLHYAPVTVNGITFLGSPIFFDGESLMKHHGATEGDILAEWEKRGLADKHGGVIDDPITWARREKERLLSLIGEADVIVTHGPPDYFLKNSVPSFGFFHFDGESFKERIQGKAWCYGHHHKRSFAEKYGCRFYNATYKGSVEKKAFTIDVNPY